MTEKGVLVANSTTLCYDSPATKNKEKQSNV